MNQQAMLRKVRQMQKEMMDTQKEIENTEFTATSNVVTVVVMGTKEIKSVIIDPEFEVEDKEDLEMLSDMIVAASAIAYRDIEKTIEELDGNVSLETEQNVAVYSDDDLKKYSIDLDSLETKKHNKRIKQKLVQFALAINKVCYKFFCRFFRKSGFLDKR